ncbi:MAG: hypothetical protein R2941_13225 [Desulfobacterales bacterium]
MKRILAIFMLLLFFAFGLAVNLRAEEDSAMEPSEAELLLLELINEARRAPLDMAASLGMDTEKILADLPDLYDILTKGMKPVVFDERIYKAAYSHAVDMIAGQQLLFPHIP